MVWQLFSLNVGCPPFTHLHDMHANAQADGMERVVCIPGAKVRIVKVWDPVLKLACDMNVNNTLALENTRLIKTYVQIDERVRQLGMIVKYWTKQRILNDAGETSLPFSLSYLNSPLLTRSVQLVEAPSVLTPGYV